tara:strand:+ start:483 stop:746 length:264 start_codon:yes stop_codon:yes gene_type:complete
MKIFFYKSILVLFLFLIGFHYSINYVEKSVKRKIQENFSKERVELLKNKIKSEMETAIDKKVFISQEDAELINNFLKKIDNDLNKKN